MDNKDKVATVRDIDMHPFECIKGGNDGLEVRT